MYFIHLLFSCPVVSDSLWPHGLQHPGLPVPHHLPELEFAKFIFIASVMPSSLLILWCLLLLLLSILTSIRDFSNEWCIHIRWPKYWSFSFIINPSSEYSGLTPLRLTGLISLLSKGKWKWKQKSRPTLCDPMDYIHNPWNSLG